MIMKVLEKFSFGVLMSFLSLKFSRNIEILTFFTP